MGVPDASVFWLALAALVAATLAAPDHFDQRQTGQYNVRIQLKELKIVAVAMPDGDDEGDYDEGNYDYEDPVDPLELHTKSTTPKTTTTKTTTTTASIPSESPNGEPDAAHVDSVDPVEHLIKSTTPKSTPAVASTTTKNIPSQSSNGEPNDPLDPMFIYSLNHTKSTTPKTTNVRTTTTATTTRTTSALPNREPNTDPLAMASTREPLEISSTADSLTTSAKNISTIPSTGDKPMDTAVNISLSTSFWNDITSFNDVAATVDAEEPNSTDVGTDSVTNSEPITPIVTTISQEVTTKRVNNKYDPTKRIRARVRCRPGYSKDRSGRCRKTRITVKPVADIVSQ